jgi:hypothetical protein
MVTLVSESSSGLHHVWFPSLILETSFYQRRQSQKPVFVGSGFLVLPTKLVSTFKNCWETRRGVDAFENC